MITELGWLFWSDNLSVDDFSTMKKKSEGKIQEPERKLSSIKKDWLHFENVGLITEVALNRYKIRVILF